MTAPTSFLQGRKEELDLLTEMLKRIDAMSKIRANFLLEVLDAER